MDFEKKPWQDKNNVKYGQMIWFSWQEVIKQRGEERVMPSSVVTYCAALTCNVWGM